MPEAKESPLENVEIAKKIIEGFGDEFPESREGHEAIFKIYYPDGLIRDKPLQEASDRQIKTIARSLYFNAYLFGFEEFTEGDRGVLRNIIKFMRSGDFHKKIGLEERICIGLDSDAHKLLGKFYGDVQIRYVSEETVKESFGSNQRESMGSVYNAFIGRKNQWRIKNHPVPTRAFLKKAFSTTKILGKGGEEIYLNKASGEELEEFCLLKFEEYGWGIPPDYSSWEEESE